MILKNSKGETIIPHPKHTGISVCFGPQFELTPPSALDESYTLHSTPNHRAIIIDHATGEIVQRYHRNTPEEGIDITDHLRDGLHFLLVVENGDGYSTPTLYFNKDGRIVGHYVVNPLTICRRKKDGKWVKFIRHMGVRFIAHQWRDVHHTLYAIDNSGRFIGTKYFPAEGNVTTHNLTDLFSEVLVREVTLASDLSDFGEIEIINDTSIKYHNDDNSSIKYYSRDVEKYPDFFDFFKVVLRDIRLQSETKRLRKIMKYMDFKDHRNLCDLFTDLNMPMMLNCALLTGAHYRTAAVILENPTPKFDPEPLIKLGLIKPEFDFSKTHIRDAYRLMRRIILQTAQFKVK